MYLQFCLGDVTDGGIKDSCQSSLDASLYRHSLSGSATMVDRQIEVSIAKHG